MYMLGRRGGGKSKKRKGGGGGGRVGEGKGREGRTRGFEVNVGVRKFVRLKLRRLNLKKMKGEGGGASNIIRSYIKLQQ